MATIIFKPTEACNSNCVYCDVVRKPLCKSTISSEDLLRLLFIRIDEYLLLNPSETIMIEWHGGEPLLLGPAYFEKACEFQEKYCCQTKSRISHGIQSNLTLFSMEFVNPLKRLGINAFGSSYDPEPHIRGPGEGIDSDRYNKMFLKGSAMLEKGGFGFGIIYVVTRKSLPRPLDVFFCLTNLKLNGAVMMNPVLIYGEGRKEIAITPEEYVAFLTAIFPTWWKNRHRYPMLNPFSSYVRNIIDRQCRLGCVDSGSCAYGFVNVSPNGDASQCGRSSDWGLLDYGNIQDRSLSDIFEDFQREELMERTRQLEHSDCKGCRFWDICHGGCPLDAYAQHKNFMHKSEWCEAKRGFIEGCFEPVTGTKFIPHEN